MVEGGVLPRGDAAAVGFAGSMGPAMFDARTLPPRAPTTARVAAPALPLATGDGPAEGAVVPATLGVVASDEDVGAEPGLTVVSLLVSVGGAATLCVGAAAAPPRPRYATNDNAPIPATSVIAIGNASLFPRFGKRRVSDSCDENVSVSWTRASAADPDPAATSASTGASSVV